MYRVKPIGEGKFKRQISEGKPQATSVENMTPLADLEHGQGIVDPKLDSIVTLVDHVEPVEQGVWHLL